MALQTNISFFPSQELPPIGMIGIPSQKNFQKQFFSQKHAYLAQLEALPFVKNDYKNVRHSERKLKILLNKAGTGIPINHTPQMK